MLNRSFSRATAQLSHVGGSESRARSVVGGMVFRFVDADDTCEPVSKLTPRILEKLHFRRMFQMRVELYSS